MRILDDILAALLAAALVMLTLAVWQPWDASVTEAVAVHAAEPLDVNDRIIVRWEYPDGTEAMPPQEVALWEYVWQPQQSLSDRITGFEFVAGVLLRDPEMQGHLERHGVSPDEQAALCHALGVR